MLEYTRRRHLGLLGAALATPMLPRLARAQAWPSKQIRAVIPFTAGSTIDIVARIVFEPLSHQLGQSIRGLDRRKAARLPNLSGDSPRITLLRQFV